MRKHEKSYDHICDTCGKAYNHPDNLKRHIQFVHEKFRPFTCEFCQQTFSRRLYYEDHINKKHRDINNVNSDMESGRIPLS